VRRAVLLALLCLALAPLPAAAGGPEAYLAYRIRLARGEEHYRLDVGLSRLAEKRAREYAAVMGVRPWGNHHRPLVEVPCGWWGEVLGWTRVDGPAGIRWVMAAWRRSPAHWAAIVGTWAYYGVGAYYRGGAWYMVVVFAQCRISA